MVCYVLGAHRKGNAWQSIGNQGKAWQSMAKQGKAGQSIAKHALNLEH
jgi:hypothetical protein